TRHIHHKANSIGSGHASEDHAFFQDVISAIGTARAILVTGPANAKTELIKHIHRHNPQLIERIAAVETVDHPTDGAFHVHARREALEALRVEGVARAEIDLTVVREMGAVRDAGAVRQVKARTQS